MLKNQLIIYPESDAYLTDAKALSDKLDIPFAKSRDELDTFLSSFPSIYEETRKLSDEKDKPLYLKINESGLSLTDGRLELRGDFIENIPRLKPNNLQKEMLVKSAKIKNISHTPILIDATAGMGEDSLLLAAAGFNVILYEYDPIISALLKDTLNRASSIPELSDIVSRMELHTESSIEAMNHLNFIPDVILLDPMFPARTKSALVKKKFQLLQKLEHPCSDENDLLFAAIAVTPHKIVIKRPLKGPFLAGIKPDYSLSGKAIRYDCILPGTRKF
ncbi:class I SAM-dependent methyltransferase [Oribacterium sp. WCC10]|uniref:class I SAM-dependent methyltransferase n=1 Tax=Oribacterium sp. WCC10 TaxID=1855343 RepID=UPI0008F33A66|nr:class I SAM-dependent methyltransferase [Oribacterium sp. WCC10]SFG81422.1 16S rRNA (guanine1516-N2)-methyltransferase [Oribacterium sp. WCC10]